MSNKKTSLKNQIDLYDFFKEKYFKIIDDLNFDHEKDCESRDLLSDILRINHKRYAQELPGRDVQIRLEGGTNSPPTDGSSNADYLGLIDIFDNSTAYNLTISINT